MARILIILGVMLILAGLLWALFERMGLGRLPGDILIERGNTRIWIPITTGIVISIVLTVVLNLLVWLLNR